ncbi:MAG: PadR family transcriptional regulator [Bacteroidetes bacterium]|nr:PadR family transcriptional regulator [Bacteroidota bacterium]
MNTENPNAQMRKGVLELCILAIIATQDAYASDIIMKLKEARLIVVEGTLYPLLTRLKNEGLTVYRWEESKSGPPRKYHQITDLGMKNLEELKTDWLDLVESVEKIIKTSSPRNG